MNIKISELCRDTNDFSNTASSKTGKDYDPLLDWEASEHTHAQKIQRVQEPAGRRECSPLNQPPFSTLRRPHKSTMMNPSKNNQEDRLEKQ